MHRILKKVCHIFVMLIICVVILAAANVRIVDQIFGTMWGKPDIGSVDRRAGKFRGVGIVVQNYANNGNYIMPYMDIAIPDPSDPTVGQFLIYGSDASYLLVYDSELKWYRATGTQVP